MLTWNSNLGLFSNFLGPSTYGSINSTVNQQKLPFSDPTHLFADVILKWSLFRNESINFERYDRSREEKYIVIQKLVKMGLSILRKAIINLKQNLIWIFLVKTRQPDSALIFMYVCTMCLLVGPSASRACQTLDFGLVPREPQGGRHRRPWSISSLSYFI